MIAIIDYGMGNLRSVLHKLGRLGIDAEVASSQEVIENVDKIILPGVGSFARGMVNLEEAGLVGVLNDRIIDGKTPVLGICLGMQLFSKHSEEGNAEGFGWVDAQTRRFNFNEKSGNFRIPHVGWNSIEVKREDPLFTNIGENERFYFTHSYHLDCANKNDVLATTHYGYDFPSVIRKENIVGVQFHPEKSHKLGIQLIKNFVDYI